MTSLSGIFLETKNIKISGYSGGLLIAVGTGGIGRQGKKQGSQNDRTFFPNKLHVGSAVSGLGKRIQSS